MTTDPELHRREEDRNRETLTRLSQLERVVAALDNGMNAIKLEQQHSKELWDARFRILEKNAEVAAGKLNDIHHDITAMASDASKSPAGRAMQLEIERQGVASEDCEKKINEAIRHFEQRISDHERWRQQIDGIVAIGKWLVTPSAVTALVITLLRTIRIID